MSNDTTATETRAEPRPTTRSPWLDYRRKRFWAVVAVLVYTLAGFFLVPVLVSHLVVKNVQDSMDREASIAAVRFNPYVLSLQVDGFELADHDGEGLLSFDSLFVNFQLSSLFRWAWTFREIRLDGAHLLYERFTAEDSRLSRLLADMARLNPEPADAQASGQTPRLLVGVLSLNEGSLLFRDHAPGETVDIPAGPVTVTVHDLNTLPDRHGRQNVQIRLAQGALLTWSGDIGLVPLTSTGSLTLENSELDTLIPYLKTLLPLDSIRARLSARTDYSLGLDEDGSLSLSLSGLETQLEEVAVNGLEPSSEFLAFDALNVSGAELRYPANTLEIGSVELVNPFLDAWLGEDGQPGLLQLVPEGGEAGDGADAATAWTVSIAQFSVENGRVAVADRSIEPKASLAIENLSLEMAGIDNRDDTAIPLSLDLDLAGGGRAALEGTVVLLPGLSFSGTGSVDAIPLALAQPYVQQQLALAIEGGALRTSAEIGLDSAGAFHATGGLLIDALQIRDTAENESLLAWDRMEIDRYEVDSAAATANVSSMRFTSPYSRIHIREDLSTNIGGLVIRQPETEEATENGSATWSAVLGGIAIDDGSMDFSDFSLPLPFATKITGMDGTISTIDSNSAEPSNIRLEGQVDEFGLARIAGSMNLLDPIVHTNVSVEFRNLMMTNLSPYTAQFAGRKIDDGKLDLDLVYAIDGGQLNGQNDVVLSDLLLGEEVDSPDAVSLPLGLAVALLKDSNGVIDIELPVEGNVNDPEFKIGGVVWKALAGLITKVVTAPFKLLGGLIGVDSEDFGKFQFLAGRADLTPPELEKVAQLQQALAQRPELALEIAGVYDPAVDRAALQQLSLRTAVFERLGRDPTEEGDAGVMLDEQVRGVLEALFTERFPGSPLEEIRSAHAAPPVDDPEGQAVVDETAYSADLRDRLQESEPVGAEELEALAKQRAETVTQAFLAGGLDPARISQAAPAEAESEDDEWVVMELGVASD